MSEWVDDVRLWPKLEFQDIYEYFVNAPSCDNQPNRNFRSISEGMNYLHSGWVGVVKHKISGDNIILKGQVRFSQAINSYHHVELTVNKEDNSIITVKCDCIASEGKCCSHSAGLAFKINAANKKGYIGIACTDASCVWNRCTQENVVPDTVENIRCNGNSSMASNVVSFSTDDQVTEHLKQPHMQALTSIPGTILNHLLTAKPKPKSDQQPADGTTSHGLHNTEWECGPCKKVYEDYVQISQAQADTLSEQTMNQNSALWTSQRKLRITSSCAASVPRHGTNPTKWIKNHMDPTFTGNAATRYGQDHEGIARTQFERESNTKVQTTGLIVRPDKSWLGASLDGIIDDETILEIKCPTEQKLAKYKSLQGLIESGTYDVRTTEDGEYYLRRTTAASGYYMQVQVAMYCSRRSKCKFMVWSPTECVIADVKFDDEWFKEQLSRLQTFYFNSLLPAITDRINSHELQIVKPR
ncbi:uncharacterized protein [Diadema antillarum]|uniref:uncharacterized protein n=1 Tax=Diadema antillarum TaxID=105358 RepID=UPI003A86EC61